MAKAKIIPDKVLEEVRLRKHFREQGVEIFVSRARQWGSKLANSLMNDTVDTEVVQPAQLPTSVPKP